jgi:uncharacterized protein (TIGR00255 family)
MAESVIKSSKPSPRGESVRYSPGVRLRSMTGFGAATNQLEGIALTAIVRSVNHRHMDLRVHLPEWLLPLEHKARQLIQARNARGHIELRVTVESSAGSGVSIDEMLVANYMETLGRLSNSYGLETQISAAEVLQLPGVVTRREVSAGLQLSSQLENLFLNTLEYALKEWEEMRAAEGAALGVDLRRRLEILEQIVKEMERNAPKILQMAQARLTERLKILSEQTGFDPMRFAQEASLLADRTDVGEELVRLLAHIKHFEDLLDSAADAGRKLDFLLQEMNREGNTLLAKISGLGEASLEMTRQGMEVKAEIEKLREQIQNLQ